MSLSFCSLSPPSMAVPFRHHPSLAAVHAPDHEEERLPETSGLKFHCRTVTDTSYRQCVSSSSRSGFGHFSANSSSFSNWSRWFWNPYEILSKMTPSLPSFITGKNWHVLPCKQNFKSWSETNEALFWGNNPESVLMAKNASIWYILPMFGTVCKKLHFWRQTVEIAWWDSAKEPIRIWWGHN